MLNNMSAEIEKEKKKEKDKDLGIKDPKKDPNYMAPIH